MKVLVATDARHPQVNGLVRRLTMMAVAARQLGVAIGFPDTGILPLIRGYGDLRLALRGSSRIAELIELASMAPRRNRSNSWRKTRI